MQIFFPNLAAYTAIIIMTNVIFLYTVFNKKSNTANKLINSPFFISIMVLMVHTIDLISKNNINIYQRKEVYSNDKIVTIIESTTLIFTLWIIILTSKMILKKLIKKSDEKIKEEYKEKMTDESITNETPTVPITPTVTANNINETPINEIPTVPITPIEVPNTISTVPINEIPTVPTTPTVTANSINAAPINETPAVPTTPTVTANSINAAPINEIPTVPTTPTVTTNNSQPEKNEITNVPNVFDSSPINNNTQKEEKKNEIEVLKI